MKINPSAQRVMYNAIQRFDVVENINITNNMIVAFKSQSKGSIERKKRRRAIKIFSTRNENITEDTKKIFEQPKMK